MGTGARLRFFYEAENDGNPCYRATGSFSQRDYDIYARDGSEVATIGRQLFELLEDRADTCFRRVDSPQTGRGDAAAATWIFRRDGSRRRRGRDVDIP